MSAVTPFLLLAGELLAPKFAQTLEHPARILGRQRADFIAGPSPADCWWLPRTCASTAWRHAGSIRPQRSAPAPGSRWRWKSAQPRLPSAAGTDRPAAPATSCRRVRLRPRSDPESTAAAFRPRSTLHATPDYGRQHPGVLSTAIYTRLASIGC